MKRHTYTSAVVPVFASLAIAMMLMLFSNTSPGQASRTVLADNDHALDQASARIEQTTVVTQEMYLPIMISQRSVISGHATQNGDPLAGATVSLQWVAPSFMHPGTITTTVTDENGDYQFVNVRSTLTSTVGQGERFRAVVYGDLTWYTPLITYTAGTVYTFPSVDTTNLTLLDPVEEATITLPYTFTWTMRPSAPTDSYEVRLFWAPYSLGAGEVGYVDSAVVPLSILQGNEFPYMDWFVRVYSENGFGDTEMKRIYFAWSSLIRQRID